MYNQVKILPLEVARGCIFKCNFCSFPLNGKGKGEAIRDFSYIRDELIENYELYGIEDYWLTDDTFNDDNMDKFRDSLTNLTKSGSKVTWWNSVSSKNNYYSIDSVTYEAVKVNPPSNCYFNYNTYYLPKKQF